ncbi:TRADD-N-associated membrane domain-containing protein [Geodermatophilus sp. URMC 63]
MKDVVSGISGVVTPSAPVEPSPEEKALPGRSTYYSWYDSAAYQRTRAKTTPIRIGVWLFSLTAAAVYPFRGLLGIQTPAAAGLGAIVCAIVAIALGATSSIMTLNAQARYQQAVTTGELYSAIENTEDFTSLPDLLKLNRKAMETYQNLSVRQATTSFRMAEAAMAIGLLVLAAGIVLSLSANSAISKIASAGLATVGGILSGFISRTFIRLHENAMRQLHTYYEQPLINSYMLTAERLTQNLDAARRGQVVEDIIREALARSIPKQSAIGHPLGGRRTRLRKPTEVQEETGEGRAAAPTSEASSDTPRR